MGLEVRGSFAKKQDELLIDWLSDKPALVRLSKVYGQVLIDSYLAAPQDYLFLQSIFGRVIALDDYNRIPYHADVLLNPNIFGDKVDYRTTARVIAGRQYVILREAFRKELDKVAVRKQASRVLVTFGGDDYRKLCPKISQWLRDEPIRLTIIAGNDAYAAALREQLGGDVEVIGYVEADQMRHQMLNTDIVVSACGQTLHELAYLGVPTIGICIDIDQEPNRDAYCDLGFLPARLDWNDAQLEKKVKGVLQQMENSELRKRISEAGLRSVDGRGVDNIFGQLFLH